MDIPAAQAQDLPFACGFSGPAEGAVVPATCQALPPEPSASEEGRDNPTPPPRRAFFVSVRYRRLGRGELIPLASEVN